MTILLDRYRVLINELLFVRETEGGELPEEVESSYVEQLDELWWQLSEAEQAGYEAELAHARAHKPKDKQMKTVTYCGFEFKKDENTRRLTYKDDVLKIVLGKSYKQDSCESAYYAIVQSPVGCDSDTGKGASYEEAIKNGIELIANHFAYQVTWAQSLQRAFMNKVSKIID
jgi:predicted RNase H-like HicB family nuclease